MGYYCIAIVLFVDAIVVFPFVFYIRKNFRCIAIVLRAFYCTAMEHALSIALHCVAMELLFSIALQWDFCFLLHCNGTFLSVPIALQWYDFALDGSCNGRVCDC